MTKEIPDWILEYVREMMPVMGLDNWRIRLQWADEQEEPAIGNGMVTASISITPQYMEAVIMLQPEVDFSEPSTSNKNTIRHEMVHCVVAPLSDWVQSIMMEKLHASDQEALDEPFRYQVEFVTSMVERIVKVTEEENGSEWNDSSQNNDSDSGELGQQADTEGVA